MRTVSKFLISIVASLGILALAWVFFFYSQLGMPTRNTYWTHALVEQKSRAVQNAVGEKIVIIAGSSGNFNVDAEKISKATGIKTINFGTHAILPLEYMLDHIKDKLHPGDTAVLALEYLYYAADERLSRMYLDYLLARDPEYFLTRPMKEKFEIISAVPFKRLITPFKESFFKSEEPYAFNVYTEFFYSPYGDQHANNVVFLNQTMRNGRNSAPPETRIQTILGSKYNWKLLAAFSVWCNLNNIKLLAAPPATLKFAVYDTPAYRAQFAMLKKALEDIGVPFIGDPYSVMYDPALFFDTNYHTNNKGKAAYTDSLTAWLKTQVGFRSSTLPLETIDKTPIDRALENFTGWMPVAGLLTLEGPYPASNLPVVVWGAPQTQLQVEMESAGSAEFRIEFLPNQLEQIVTIMADDKQIYKRRIIKGTEFSTIEVNLELSAGIHLLTIYSDEKSKSLSGTSILFRMIKFTPM